jgi:catechol 2,3-dioxygenase-like lactoylglutathione lyase family enzyme
VQVERTDFLSVPVTNIERSRRFYRETLGIEEIVPDNSFPEFQLGENVSLYLIDPTKVGRDFEGPSRGAIAVRVPDVTAARAELESKGVEFRGDTFDTGVCHMAFFTDPDGNELMLHRRYAPHE